MKKIFLFLLTSLLSFSSFAQNLPQGIAYQAVAVKEGPYSVAGENPQAIYWSNKDIKVRFTILDQYPNPTDTYQEFHPVTTDDYGVFNLIIGQGTIISGDFETIPWELGTAHLQVEIDFDNDDNYTVTSFERFWSVPYAKYSQASEETDPIFDTSVAKGITSTDTAYWNNKLDSYTETDPIFNASVAKGITSTDTAYWNNKLDSYTETDPIFNASVAKGIKSTDTAYWNNKLDSYTETDPIFNASVAKGVTSKDTAYWNNKLDSYTETDPIFNASVAKGVTSTDTAYWNNKLDSYTETDPIFNASVAKGITSTDTAYWNRIQDRDSTNELQQISISNDTLFLSNGGFVKLPNSLGKSVSSSVSSNSEIEYHSLTKRSIVPGNSVNDTFNFNAPIDGFKIFWTANYQIYSGSSLSIHALDQQGDTINLTYSNMKINLGIDGTSNASSRPSINNDWGTKQVISDGLSIGNTNWRSSSNGHLIIEANSLSKIHKLVVKQSAGGWGNKNITQKNVSPSLKLYTARNTNVGNGSNNGQNTSTRLSLNNNYSGSIVTKTGNAGGNLNPTSVTSGSVFLNDTVPAGKVYHITYLKLAKSDARHKSYFKINGQVVCDGDNGSIHENGPTDLWLGPGDILSYSYGGWAGVNGGWSNEWIISYFELPD